MSLVSEAKEVSIINLLKSLGISVSRTNKVKCPFHHDKTASMHLYTKSNSYYCFGCNAYGDSVSFIMRYYKTSFTDAVNILTNKRYRTIKHEVKEPEIIPCDELSKAEVEEIYTDFINMLTLTDKGFNYINKQRCIPESLINKYNIKSIDDTDEIMTKLKNKYSMQTLIQSGLFTVSAKTGKPYFTFFLPSIIIPHSTKNNLNRYNYCHSRSYEGKTFFKPSYMIKPKTFKGNLLIRDIIIVESAICALSYEAITGNDNFIAIASLNINVIKKILNIYGSRITLMLDNDEITPTIYQQLTNDGFNPKIINPEQFAKSFGITQKIKDINDILLLVKHSQ